METNRVTPRGVERNVAAVLEELLQEDRAIRRELAALRHLFDTFAGTFLNARFPHGRPIDRWRRRG